MPVRRPADRRRALLRAEPVRRRRAHPRALRQLPQRHGDARGGDCRRRRSRAQRPKLMPEAVAMRTYREHQAFYDKLQKDVAARGRQAGRRSRRRARAGRGERAAVGASSPSSTPSVILISGCQDNQTSMDGEHNGAFTEQLLKVWNQGGFQGNYAQLPRAHQGAPAGDAVAEPVHARRGGRVPGAEAVQRLMRRRGPRGRRAPTRAPRSVHGKRHERHHLHRPRAGAARADARARRRAAASRRRFASARSAAAASRCASPRGRAKTSSS